MAIYGLKQNIPPCLKYIVFRSIANTKGNTRGPKIEKQNKKQCRVTWTIENEGIIINSLMGDLLYITLFVLLCKRKDNVAFIF